MVIHVFRFYMQVLKLNVNTFLVTTWYFHQIRLNWKLRPFEINTKWTNGSYSLISNRGSSYKLLNGFVFFEIPRNNINILLYHGLSHVQMGVIFPVLVSIRFLNDPLYQIWVVSINDSVSKLVRLRSVPFLWDHSSIWKFTYTLYFCQRFIRGWF